jgi:hypothetical protein
VTSLHPERPQGVRRNALAFFELDFLVRLLNLLRFMDR